MTGSPRTDLGIPPGTRVEIVSAGRKPLINPYVGRKGVTERPESDGCYVRFSDRSYVFLWWDEMKEATS